MSYVRNINGKSMISVSSISEQLDIPPEVIDWNIYNFETEHCFSKTGDFVKKDKVSWMSLKVFLYLITERNISKNYKTIEIVIENYYDDGSKKNSVKEAEEMSRDFEVIRAIAGKYCAVEKKQKPKAVKVLSPEFSTRATSSDEKQKDTPRKNYPTYAQTKALKAAVPELPEDIKNKNRTITESLKKYANEHGGTLSLLLRQIYKKMRDTYGIVFEQEEKEMREKYNIDKDIPLSTMRVASENAMTWSIFKSIAENILQEAS